MGIYTRNSRCQTLIACLLLTAAVPRAAHAQAKPPPVAKSPLTVDAQAAPIPDAFKLNMLIRTTLIALSQANQTGNYSVLRDLGTPQFQSLNTDARLAEIFTALRNRKLDLSPVLFFDPKLIREPGIEGGLLRLTGYIPTDPERILFDMGFERVADQWRLSAIVIDVQPTPPGSTTGNVPAANVPTQAKPKAKP